MIEKLGLRRSQIPLYVQLEQILKSEIMTAKYLPGEQIPTEKEIAATYRVSIITARQAILNLVQEGLLLREKGRGTFVQEPESLANTKNIMTLSVRGNIDNILPENLSSQKVNVLEITRINSSRRLAEALKIPAGQEVIQIRRTRSENDILVSYIKNCLPLEIGQKITEKDLLSSPMLQILMHKLELPVSKGVQYISAIVADYETATALSVNISSPLLYLETTIFDEKEKPVEFVQTFYRSDQFKYTLTMDMVS